MAAKLEQDDAEAQAEREQLARDAIERMPKPLLTDESPFGQFLLACRGRPDRVGQLADVIARDPGWPGGDDIAVVRKHMRSFGVRPFVMASLDLAWREHLRLHGAFQRTQARRKKSKAARAARRRNRR